METENFYSKKHLLVALKAAGLPCSYPTLIRYEKTGRIPRSAKTIIFNDREWRVYTREDINRIICKLKGI